MVTDVKQTSYGDHFTIYIQIQHSYVVLYTRDDYKVICQLHLNYEKIDPWHIPNTYLIHSQKKYI